MERNDCHSQWKPRLTLNLQTPPSLSVETWRFSNLPLSMEPQQQLSRNCLALEGSEWRCVIPVKHGLHFHGAVLPLRDPYRKFCLLEHQESRCHLQQNSRCSLGSFTCRRLHMLALGSAAGSSATAACRAAECCWKPDSSVNLILWVWGMAEAVLLLTALWESPWKLLPVGSSVRKEYNVHLEMAVLQFHSNCLLEMGLVGGYVKTETFPNASQCAPSTHSWFGRVVPWLSSVCPEVWESSSRCCVMWNPLLLPLCGSGCQLGFLICCHWHSLPTLL